MDEAEAAKDQGDQPSPDVSVHPGQDSLITLRTLLTNCPLKILMCK